jgi:predicted enzyme related to lactoylglutathione lyase
MNINGIVYNLNSGQPDAVRAFYRDQLNFKTNPDMGEGALLAAGTPFIVDSHSEISGATKEPPRTFISVMVDDVEEEQARLQAAGVRFLGPPSRQPISFATFVDPDGNYGQIFSMAGVPAGTEQFVISRYSDQPERLREFFRNVVGLSDDYPDLGNPFLAGGTSIYVSEHSEVHGPTQEPARIMINFFIDDLAAEQARIEGHGVKFIRSAGREPWGGVISTFADPDGSYLQLIEMQPA